MAKRRPAKITIDFVEGGLEDERGLERNTSAFQRHGLPRYLVDVSKRDQSARIFRRVYASPFGHLADRRCRAAPAATPMTLAAAARYVDIAYIRVEQRLRCPPDIYAGSPDADSKPDGHAIAIFRP